MLELGRAHLSGLQVVPKGFPGLSGRGRQEQDDLVHRLPMDPAHSEMHQSVQELVHLVLVLVLRPAQFRFQSSRLLDWQEAVVSGRHGKTCPHSGH